MKRILGTTHTWFRPALVRHWWPKFCGAKTEKKKPEKDFRERGRAGRHEIIGTTVGRRGEHLLNAPRLFHTHDVYYA
jgi:hypothetical protein